MMEGLLVEVLNLVPSDYALTITNSIGQILIEKDKNPIDIFLHLDSMNYWANFSKDDKNKEAYINSLELIIEEMHMRIRDGYCLKKQSLRIKMISHFI